MAEAPGEVKPQLVDGRPRWWHQAGHIEGVAIANDEEVVIKGGENYLSITPARNYFWQLQWNMTHPGGGWSQGAITCTTGQLRRAFALANRPHTSGEQVLKEYGGDDGSDNAFIRWGSFLNIPGPGTRYAGDLNVSIFLTPASTAAIAALIAAAEERAEKEVW